MDSSQQDDTLASQSFEFKRKRGFPRHPRSCNVKGFVRSLEIEEFGEEKIRCHSWDVGVVYNPSWATVCRSYHRLGDKPMYAIPRLQAMLLFFTRRIRQFEIPQNYTFHCDVELWEHFPEAMRHITHLSMPPIGSPPQGYTWNIKRSVNSKDLSNRKFDLSGFFNDDMRSIYILGFFQQYHSFFHPTYTMLSDELLWTFFPRTLTVEATIDGHVKDYYQPRVYSITLSEQSEAVREQLHDEVAREIPDKNISWHNIDGGDSSNRRKIHWLRPETIEGFIFPLGATFLAKKITTENKAALHPWTDQPLEVEDMLRYLEMRVRTTAMPPFYDAVRDKLLWDVFPKACPFSQEWKPSLMGSYITRGQCGVTCAKIGNLYSPFSNLILRQL